MVHNLDLLRRSRGHFGGRAKTQEARTVVASEQGSDSTDAFSIGHDSAREEVVQKRQAALNRASSLGAIVENKQGFRRPRWAAVAVHNFERVATLTNRSPMLCSRGMNRYQHDTARFRLRVSIVGLDDEQVFAEMIGSSSNQFAGDLVQSQPPSFYRPHAATSAGRAVSQCKVP